MTDVRAGVALQGEGKAVDVLQHATAGVKADPGTLAPPGWPRQREYPTYMADERMDVEMPSEVVEGLRRMADKYGVTVDTLMRQIAEEKIRHHLGRELVHEWEAEHGAFTAEEKAETRREVAEAEARYLGIAEAS